MDTNTSSSSSPDAQTANPAASSPTSPQPSQPTPQPVPPTPPSVTPPPLEEKKRKGLPLGIIILLLTLSFVAGLVLAGWYFQSQLNKTQMQKNAVTEEKVTLPTTLVIGTDATFPPMEFINKQGGLIGYDIDLGYRIANELGMKAEFKNIKWDDLFTSLENKQINVIISSVTINDERKQKYLFSQPYINAGQVAITQRANTTINAAADLKGKKIAVQKGTTSETEAVKLTENNLVIRFDDYQQATKSLVEGKVDAILSDLTAAKGIITDNPTLKISTDPLTNEYYGVVLRQQDTQLEERISGIIKTLETKGVLTDLKQKWLD
jgi:polar amino acid transport system substrate-binding protein